MNNLVWVNYPCRLRPQIWHGTYQPIDTCTTCHIPCSPIKFYLRNWDEEIFEQVPCQFAQFVHDRGHGKVLRFLLSRGCTPLPTWPGQSFYLDAHFCSRTGVDRGRDLLCAITRTISKGRASPTVTTSTTTWPLGSGFIQHTLSSQCPFSMWLYGKLMSKVV